MDVMNSTQVGVLTTVIGMGIVVLVLIILSFLISILNYGVNAAQSRKTTQSKENVSNSAEIAISAKINEAAAVQNQEGISPAIVAAITASVCMLTGKSAHEFKFKGIWRAPGSRPMWGMAGIAEIITNRQRYVERGNRS